MARSNRKKTLKRRKYPRASLRTPKFRHNRITMRSCRSSKGSLRGSLKKRAIVETFMEMLNAVKIYHWNTHSYSQHKATDELHERLGEHVDKFVEVLLGKDGSRLHNLDEKIHLIHSRKTGDFRQLMFAYREYLIGMNDCFDESRDSDLLNIRDEILADINQFLYLLTLQ
jgi:DNA-binding ferritin-like protein